MCYLSSVFFFNFLFHLVSWFKYFKCVWHFLGVFFFISELIKLLQSFFWFLYNIIFQKQNHVILYHNIDPAKEILLLPCRIFNGAPPSKDVWVLLLTIPYSMSHVYDSRKIIDFSCLGKKALLGYWRELVNGHSYSPLKSHKLHCIKALGTRE